MVSLYIIYTRKFWKKESYVWDQFWEIDSRAVENLTAKNWLKSEAAIRGVPGIDPGIGAFLWILWNF